MGGTGLRRCEAAASERPPRGATRHPQERRARPDGGRRGRAGCRRDGGRLHELGRRLRGPLHSRARGRRHPAALARRAGRPRRRPRARAGPLRGDHPDRRRGARGDPLRLPGARRGGSRRHPPARREPARRDHGSAARVGARRDLRPRRGPPPRLRPQRPPRHREPGDAAARVPAAAPPPGRSRRGPDLLGRVPGRAAGRAGPGDALRRAGPRRHASTALCSTP